jgi:Protein of unknown function (DUF3015)
MQASTPFFFSTLKGTLMKTFLCIASLVIAAPAAIAQANNVGSCGWGSKVFDGQKGVAPQVLAATTNGTSGNQTFGITFGTSGCTQDGVVNSTWKTAMFIDGNKLALARDAAAGQGESMDALAALMGVQVADKAYFNAAVKSQFATVFASDAVAANLKAVMLADARLAGYAAAI